MQLLTGLRWRLRRLRRDQVAERAGRVIDRAMFDIGIDNLLNGTVMLDEHFRPRFFSAAAACARPGVATVVLSQLDEARALQALTRSLAFEADECQAHCAALLTGVLREFHSQSSAFRALR